MEERKKKKKGYVCWARCFVICFYLKGGKKSREYIKVRFNGGLTVPDDWVLFMLSVTVGGGLLQVPRERKSY